MVNEEGRLAQRRSDPQHVLDNSAIGRKLRDQPAVAPNLASHRKVPIIGGIDRIAIGGTVDPVRMIELPAGVDIMEVVDGHSRGDFGRGASRCNREEFPIFLS